MAFPPKYRLHKGSGQALIEYQGRRIYLGKHGSAESQAEYARLLQHIQRTGALPVEKTINELALAYVNFVERYYVKDGELTTEAGNIKAALRFLVDSYGDCTPDEFGPRELKLVRERMSDGVRSRPTINRYVNLIRRCFAWGVEEGEVGGNTLYSLKAVRPLKKGRCDAPEPTKVRPVAVAVINATLQHLSPIVADMVRLQLATGARPGEIRRLRPCEIDTSAEVWQYKPATHKTEHHDIDRLLFLGPKAQEILRPYLARDPESYCFSPAEAMQHRNHARRQLRQSPMTPSQRRRNAKSDPTCGARDHYDKNAYARAISRACRKACVEQWNPHRLRHTLATIVRGKYGLEAAQAVLGHSSADVTQIYAERDYETARRVMAEIG